MPATITVPTDLMMPEPRGTDSTCDGPSRIDGSACALYTSSMMTHADERSVVFARVAIARGRVGPASNLRSSHGEEEERRGSDR